MTSPINFLLLLCLLSVGANGKDNSKHINYQQDGKYRIVADIHLINEVDYKKKGHYQILVEIPTGSREKWEVDHKTGHIEWEFRDGKPREVKFLGYPGNYGFIPQTLSGDNDPLDIIVLSESAPRGAVLQVRILGMLVLSDGGESDNKVIAITDNGAFKKIDTLAEMLVKRPNVISIVRQWFEGYKAPGKMMFLGYEDKNKTLKYIEKAHGNWLSYYIK
ncbi:MAG: inorganic diphosphatase [Alcanivoracaceae bacterium]|nr:inorganic diphosphatase [Alcanivoracaceae bacterium]